MKNIIFIEILLLSQSSRKSKKVTFDEKFNIIVWKNSTGKSSLLKSIYQTFWADPFETHPKWKDENVISLLKFKIIDDKENIDYYSMLKNGSTFTIFDNTWNKLRHFTSITKDLSPYINELLDFRIQINNRQNEITWLTPNYLFLPFYIDQDISWTKNWSSFSNLAQFSRWKQSLVEFYIWIKPNEYYDIKWIISKNNNLLTELNKEKSVLDKLKINIDKNFSTNNDFTNIDDFQKEINNLLEEMKILSDKKNKYINEVNDLNNKKLTLIEQIDYTSKNLKDIKISYDFLMDERHQSECPICWNNHNNTFKERFEIAKDEDNCSLLLSQLKEELINIENSLKSAINNHNDLIVQYDKINQIIIQKKADIKLIDIIKTEWKKELRKAFIDEEDELNKKIWGITSENNNLEKVLNNYINKKRIKDIKNDYINTIEKFFKELDVTNIPEKSYKNISSDVKETWSNLPRALIAYYLTILNLIKKNTTSSFCPIIIDSPNQQWQDDLHLPMILNFIIKNRPYNSQIILWMEDMCNIKFPWKIIRLEKVNSLLEEKEYDKHLSELKKYLDNSL